MSRNVLPAAVLIGTLRVNIYFLFPCVQTVEEEFDTTIPGPWMKKWELVHTNKHTDAYFAEQTHSV